MIRMEEYGIPKNFFELLAQLPWEPDERLMDLEARLMRGEFDDNESNSLANNPFKGTKKQMQYLCDKKLSWHEIAEIFDETADRCQIFARKNGIEKASRAGRPKMTIEEKIVFRQEWYEKHSPTIEKLDFLMVLYGGFVGLLAFKLNRPYRIARNMLKFRGVYRQWLRYNFYLGKGGRPKTIEEIQESRVKAKKH